MNQLSGILITTGIIIVGFIIWGAVGAFVNILKK